MKLTKKDLKWCRARCKHWQKYFGLNDIEISLDVEDLSIKLGEARLDWIARHSHIVIATDAVFDNKKEVDLVIFHEIVETSLINMYQEMSKAEIDDRVSQRIGHEIIHRFTNLIFYKNK